MTDQYDPYDDAMTQDPSYFYGQVHVEAFQGFFQTGHKGPIRFDANVHGADHKHYLVIEFTFTPLDATKQIFAISCMKWSPEFNQILRPSLEQVAEQIASIKTLTVGQFNPMREVSSMWVKTKRVPRPDNAENETWTTMEFAQVYAAEADCIAAMESETGRSATPEEIPFTPDEVAQAQASEGDLAERTALIIFLPSQWVEAKNQAERNGTDPKDEMVEVLKAKPMLAKYFTIESPEVQEVMSK
jgi:hypothetical protein